MIPATGHRAYVYQLLVSRPFSFPVTPSPTLSSVQVKTRELQTLAKNNFPEAMREAQESFKTLYKKANLLVTGEMHSTLSNFDTLVEQVNQFVDAYNQMVQTMTKHKDLLNSDPLNTLHQYISAQAETLQPHGISLDQDQLLRLSEAQLYASLDTDAKQVQHTLGDTLSIAAKVTEIAKKLAESPMSNMAEVLPFASSAPSNPIVLQQLAQYQTGSSMFLLYAKLQGKGNFFSTLA